jgi:hypothetical protein
VEVVVTTSPGAWVLDSAPLSLPALVKNNRLRCPDGKVHWGTSRVRGSFVLPQWRPVPLLKDVALLEAGIASGHYEDAVIRRAEMSSTCVTMSTQKAVGRRLDDLISFSLL